MNVNGGSRGLFGVVVDGGEDTGQGGVDTFQFGIDCLIDLGDEFRFEVGELGFYRRLESDVGRRMGTV